MTDDPKRQAEKIVDALKRGGFLRARSDLDVKVVTQVVIGALGGQGVFALDLPVVDRDWPKDAWERFWSEYPRKEASGPGKKALDKVRKSGSITFEALIAAVELYCHKVRNTEPKYICLPSTWLNGERWNDRPVDVPPNGCGEVKNGFLGRLMDNG